MNPFEGMDPILGIDPLYLFIGVGGIGVLAVVLILLLKKKRKGGSFTDPRAYEIIMNIEALEDRLKERRIEVEDFVDKTEEEIDIIRQKDMAYNNQIMHFHQEAFMALRDNNATGARTFIMNKLAVKAKLKSKENLQNLVKKCRLMVEGIANHQQSLNISREETESLGRREEVLQDEDPFYLIVETLSLIDRDVESYEEKLADMRDKKRDIQSASVKVDDEQVDSELVEMEKEAGFSA
ncbi:MAG: hypothetical protein QF415_05830 [Candidatus Undinarchaeales archaeon]|nr:hypothetical protein [Candidatus Undinarchaeales archaeon]MDP7491631.1 hypothetical protein [Candidatus Undinarchaeales archaeon]